MTTVPLSEAKARLSEIAEEVCRSALRKPFDGQWWAHRGEYRVRYTIDEKAEVVPVLDVSHRRDAYR